MADPLHELMVAEQPPLVPLHRMMLGVRHGVEARRRRRRRRLGATAVTVLALYGAGSAVVPGHDLPRVTAGLVQTGMLTCGSVPVSTGPKAKRMTASLQAPSSGQAGLRVDLQMTFSSTDGRRVFVDTGSPLTLIVRDGYVIGKYPDDGGMAAIAYGAAAPGGIPLPTNVVLSGCPHGRTDPMHPDHSRNPLPPGRYDLVAVIRETDGTKTGRPSVIVSAPTTIEVTAATGARAP
jgi:hypothetical protein